MPCLFRPETRNPDEPTIPPSPIEVLNTDHRIGAPIPGPSSADKRIGNPIPGPSKSCPNREPEKTKSTKVSTPPKGNRINVLYVSY